MRTFGWSDALVRRYEAESRPRSTIEPDYGSIPPSRDSGVGLRSLARTSVNHRAALWQLDVPDEYLARIVAGLGRNLALLAELRGQRPWNIEYVPPIVRPEDPNASRYEYTDDLGGVFFGYVAKLDRLREMDRSAFDRQRDAWPREADIFDRLRVWFALDPTRSDGSAASLALLELSEDAFWSPRLARDLLHAIRDRWEDFEVPARAALETRLLTGRMKRWFQETEEEFTTRRAWTTLNLIAWLLRAGVPLSLDWEATRDALGPLSGDWTEDRAENADEPLVSRGGAVRTNDDPSTLMMCDINEIVARNAELRGRTSDFLVENDPFLGLVRQHPERALQAIQEANAPLEAIGSAISTLLGALVPHRDESPRVSEDAVIGTLRRCQDDAIAHAVHAVGFWLSRLNEGWEGINDRDAFERFVDRFVDILVKVDLSENRDTNRRPDYVFEAINSPAGHLTEAMLRHPDLPHRADGAGLPLAWRGRIERLLSATRPHSDHALVILASNAAYLRAQDPDWTAVKVLGELDGEQWDVVLAGLMRISHPLAQPIWYAAKPAILRTLRVGTRIENDDRIDEWGTWQVMFAWFRGPEWMTDNEFADLLRDAPERVRHSVLNHCTRLLRHDHDVVGPSESTDRSAPILHLITNLWPRQLAAQTERTARDLVRVAISAGDRLLDFYDAVLPLLRRGRTLPETYLFRGIEDAAREYPHALLEMLHRISPDDPPHLSASLNEIVDAIVGAAPDLCNDPRIRKLRDASFR